MDKSKIVTICVVVVCVFCLYMANSVSMVSMQEVEDVAAVNNKKRVKTINDVQLYKDGVFTVSIPEGNEEVSETEASAQTKDYNPNVNESASAGRIDTPSMTQRDAEIAKYQEQEAWTLVTGGVFTDNPKQPFNSIKGTIEQIKSNNTANVTITAWKFKSADKNDLSKESYTKTFECNANIADSVQHIFADIYANKSQPVIDPNNFGCWVIRSMVSGVRASAHSYGCAIDINYSTDVTINGVRSGNGYGSQVVTTDMWNTLPETQNKYLILYTDSPIVKIFKAYGWYWGGDWNSTKDPMHLGYVGDGGQRSKAVQNYLDAGGK